MHICVWFVLLLFRNLNLNAMGNCKNDTTTIACLFVFPISLLILSFFYSTYFQPNQQLHHDLPNNLRHFFYSNNMTVITTPFIISTSTNNDSMEEDEEIGSLKRIEDGLSRARATIRKAGKARKYSPTLKEEEEEEGSFIPKGDVYRNPYALHQSHREMVKRFKIWIYKEGEPPFVHLGPMKYVYGVEGQFIGEMESEENNFMARHPSQAHAFFLPLSVTEIVSTFYSNPVISYDLSPLHRVVKDYVTMSIHKYPYWNRSFGADHFMLSCHDWAPLVTLEPEPYKNCIRALCNANTSEGFQPKRDVPIPEINIPHNQLQPPNSPLPPNQRHILAFFAGGSHGYIRSLLFQHWKQKDQQIQVYESLPKTINYTQIMGHSKFCLCPSGYEVATARIVEAIQSECVPVIIKNNYSLPFNDVLDWTRFSIYVPVREIPELKRILQGISDEKYTKLIEGVKKVKWHFTLHRPAKPFDMIHMILHSIWLRRLNIRLPNLN